MACFETVSLCLYILERGFTLFSRLLIATDLFGNHEKPASFPIIMITFAAAVQHPGASYRLSGETKPILFQIITIDNFMIHNHSDSVTAIARSHDTFLLCHTEPPIQVLP